MKKKKDSEKLAAPQGKPVHLGKWLTRINPLYKSKEQYEAMLREHVARMGEAQKRLYANGRRALLIVFQGMDAAGKDSMIHNVFTGINPQGCRVTGFKAPSATERKHDFLWRCVRELPEHGQIGIFNRSYYEEVIVTRVHPEFLTAQNARGLSDMKKFWRRRFEAIVDFERHLENSGTEVVKFFLHMSKEEQRQRFISRIDDEAKNWKFNAADVKERALWDSYMEAYEHAIAATTTKTSPWYVIPSDDKDNARLMVAKILADKLDSLESGWPKLPKAQVMELKSLRKTLAHRGK